MHAPIHQMQMHHEPHWLVCIDIGCDDVKCIIHWDWCECMRGIVFRRYAFAVLWYAFILVLNVQNGSLMRISMQSKEMKRERDSCGIGQFHCWKNLDGKPPESREQLWWNQRILKVVLATANRKTTENQPQAIHIKISIWTIFACFALNLNSLTLESIVTHFFFYISLDFTFLDFSVLFLYFSILYSW